VCEQSGVRAGGGGDHAGNGVSEGGAGAGADEPAAEDASRVAACTVWRPRAVAVPVMAPMRAWFMEVKNPKPTAASTTAAWTTGIDGEQGTATPLRRLARQLIQPFVDRRFDAGCE